MAILKNTEIISVNNDNLLSVYTTNEEGNPRGNIELSLSKEGIFIDSSGRFDELYTVSPSNTYTAGGGSSGGGEKFNDFDFKIYNLNPGDSIRLTFPDYEYLSVNFDVDGVINNEIARKEGKYIYNISVHRNINILSITSTVIPNSYGNSVTVSINKKGNRMNMMTSEKSYISIGYDGGLAKHGISIGNLTSDFQSNSIQIGNGACDYGSYQKGIAIGADAKTSDGTNIGAGDQTSAHPSAVCLGAKGILYAYISKEIGEIKSTSDARDKIDFQNITNAIPFINKLNPVTYRSNARENYLDENGNIDQEAYENGELSGSRRHAGFKAQEVYQALKDVYQDDNYAAVVDHSKYDYPEADVDRYYISLGSLVPFLVKAIQEQQYEIDELKKQIENIKK